MISYSRWLPYVAVKRGELDKLTVAEKPLDVLAQQMVATVASLGTFATGKGMRPTTHPEGGISEAALWQLVRDAYPYRNLTQDEFAQLLEMLSEGVETRRSRRSAYIHRDRIHGMLRPRRGARLTAITNGGAIPDTADYDVVEFSTETFVGKVHEDFAIESLAGDIFLLGNRSWRIRRVGAGKVWVDDAEGLPPTIPFWMGEAPARTLELSKAVADLRQAVMQLLPDRGAAAQWLMEQVAMAQAQRNRLLTMSRTPSRCSARCRPKNGLLPSASSMKPAACS